MYTDRTLPRLASSLPDLVQCTGVGLGAGASSQHPRVRATDLTIPLGRLPGEQGKTARLWPGPVRLSCPPLLDHTETLVVARPGDLPFEDIEGPLLKAGFHLGLFLDKIPDTPDPPNALFAAIDIP